MAGRRFQRFRQQAAEAIGRSEKSEKLTFKLAEIEKKVEGIRNGCQVTTKKLGNTVLGSGSTMDKHQRKLAQYSLGASMMEAGVQIGQQSLFGSVMTMVGQAQMDIASQMAQYEVTITHDVIAVINQMLEEDMKKIDKARKKLNSARLDMDSVKNRLKSFEHQSERSSREYNMEKLVSLKQEVDELSRKFEECQDAYATEMYSFLRKEKEYTDHMQNLVKLQITHYKNAAAQLEGMLPVFEKKMNDTQDQPAFGCPLGEHLRIYKCEVAKVIEKCCEALRENWMETEGMFRLAASSAKVKFLKGAFDVDEVDLSEHDPHAIAGCLKMYLRELPEPILTYELYPAWMKAAGIGDPDERLRRLMEVREQLPAANDRNLKYLMHFLYEFAQYSELTKMSYGNIAIVFGPNLLWPREENADVVGMVTDTALQRRLAETMIENCRSFYPDLPEFDPPLFSKFPSLSPPMAPPASPSAYTSTSPRPPDSPTATTPPSKRRDMPHPLADNALEQGVTVHLVNKTQENGISPPEKERPVFPAPAERERPVFPIPAEREKPVFPVPAERERVAYPVPAEREKPVFLVPAEREKPTPPKPYSGPKPFITANKPPSPAVRPRHSFQGVGKTGSLPRTMSIPAGVPSTPTGGLTQVPGAPTGDQVPSAPTGGGGGDSPSSSSSDRLSTHSANSLQDTDSIDGAPSTEMRPTPPIRPKRVITNSPATTTPPSNVKSPERRPAPRAPLRRAPPPPVSRKPSAPVTHSNDDEFTQL